MRGRGPKRENKFSALSNGENRIRSVEHAAAKKMLAILKKIYFLEKRKISVIVQTKAM